MKSYTDLEQSHKLAEFLPIESADMYYFLDPTPAGNIYHIVIPQTDFGVKTREPEYNEGDIPCWSLAALLGVLPFHLIINNQRYAFSMHKGLDKGGETYMFRYNVFNTDVCLYSTDYYNNPVDACVAMIEKLHELNLL